jgi:hypothetical protein
MTDNSKLDINLIKTGAKEILLLVERMPRGLHFTNYQFETS